MIELTPKEIKLIGYNRYFYEKKRQWLGMWLLVLGMLLAVIFMGVTDKLVDWFRLLIAFILMLGGLSYVFVIAYKATEVSKEFLEQWLKEYQEK